MKFQVTSEFGEFESFRSTPHTGIDFAFPKGEPLRNLQEGIIQKVVDYGHQNIGKGVFVKWSDGSTAIYGHMSKIIVHEGQHVAPGQLLGFSGSTGNSTGPHLHFGLKNNQGDFIDPSSYIPMIQNMNDLTQYVTQKSIEFSSMFDMHMDSFREGLELIFQIIFPFML